MEDVRKIIMVFAIGILFSVFVFATIDAIYERPTYDDFCGKNFYPKTMSNQNCTPLNVPIEEQRKCTDNNGQIRYEYNESGCEISYNCDTCSYEYSQAQDKYNNVKFYISGILAIIAIFVGLYLPANKNSLNEWIGTGFMLGGVFALFFGTMTAYDSLSIIIRPIVILLELGLIIFISYKKIDNLKIIKNDTK